MTGKPEPIADEDLEPIISREDVEQAGGTS